MSVLVAVALVLVATLLFTPIRIYLWVEEHRIILMWVTVVLLTAITGVIWAIAADLKEQPVGARDSAGA